ncbi:MAG: GNAT family N-acetyltransferase [Ilumatobacteraceae bacterium]
MDSPDAHLAQVNIATLRAPMDHPATADFAAGLDPVNAAGETAPGFVWRLADDSGNATSIQAFDDPLRIVNLTVWESVEALRAFAYQGVHRDFFRRRAEWFDPAASATALWWIPAGTLPTVDDAIRRLRFADVFGPSPYAFRMGQRQPRLVIAPAALDGPVTRSLIARLDAELSAMYPEPGANHFTLTAEQVAGGGFLVAHLDDEPVGCGAFRMIAPGVAELKRMFVDPSARGAKLGAALVDALEAAAAGAGATRLVLETGIRQHAAAGLYERLGFERIEPWGEYVASATTSVCMSKPCTA